MTNQLPMVLPEITTSSISNINHLTKELNIPRSFLASDDSIEYAWLNLPRQLKDIPIDKRDELIGRMCVATSVGLFDSAINYIWNSAIINLREKVKSFGLTIVAQILQKDFEEKHLLDLQDSELLEICLQINILDEQGFFFLSQARDTRNNYSAAHPSHGMIEETELLAFTKRCIQYSLANESKYTGINIRDFISSLKAGLYVELQADHWEQALNTTYDSQRAILVQMMHGMYCDENMAETTRLNIISLCKKIKKTFTSLVKTGLITNHNNYKAKGHDNAYIVSLRFFEELDLIDLLSDEEIHSLFHRAIERLTRVHQGYDNFYNEPPFAERLLEITQQYAVPSTIQSMYVHCISCCFIGNGYGVSSGAVSNYQKMIENFSPVEIGLLLVLTNDPSTILHNRLNRSSKCRLRFKTLLQLISINSVPDIHKATYLKLSK